MAAQPVPSSQATHRTLLSTESVEKLSNDLFHALNEKSVVTIAARLFQNPKALASFVYMATSDSSLATAGKNQLEDRLLVILSPLVSKYGAENMTTDFVNSAPFLNDLADRIANCINELGLYSRPLSAKQNEWVAAIQYMANCANQNLTEAATHSLFQGLKDMENELFSAPKESEPVSQIAPHLIHLEKEEHTFLTR